MFMGWATSYWNIIKKDCRMRCFNSFSWKYNFLSLLRNIRIEGHFPLMSSFRYFFKSLFRWYWDKLTSFTTEKREVSSAKSFAVEERLLLRSFIYIKKRRGPKMDPWGTPAVTGSHLDDWPFKTTLWNLWLRKLWISSNGRPVTPINFIL